MRSAVVDDRGPGGHCGGDALLGDVVRHLEVDVEPLTWCGVRVGFLEPQDRDPAGGVAHVVADRAPTLGLGAAGQQG